MYNGHMPTRLSIQPHLTREDMERRYRTAKDPVARSPWQRVWLLAQGMPSEQVAAVTGYSLTWGRIMVQRDN